jgi:hypothetical protein
MIIVARKQPLRRPHFNCQAELAKDYPSSATVVIGGLKLRQANGSLKADDLNAVNTLLAR